VGRGTATSPQQLEKVIRTNTPAGQYFNPPPSGSLERGQRVSALQRRCFAAAAQHPLHADADQLFECYQGLANEIKGAMKDSRSGYGRRCGLELLSDLNQ
jgi:hypothetical protein